MNANAELFNLEEENHAYHINRLFKGAVRFDCVVAFGKRSGLSLIKEELEIASKRGVKMRFLVGVDFYITEPAFLEKMLEFSFDNKNVTVYLVNKQDKRAFHPKVYRFTYKGKRAILIVGSANLTRGGLKENTEMSLIVEQNSDSRFDEYVRGMIAEKKAIELKKEIINEYRRKYEIYHAVVGPKVKKAEEIAEDPSGGRRALGELLEDMKDRGGKSAFATQLIERNKNRDAAVDLLNEVCDTKNMSIRRFAEIYTELCEGRWSSGGIRRRKALVIERPKIFRQIAILARECSSYSSSDLFDRQILIARQGLGIGPNVITEVTSELR